MFIAKASETSAPTNAKLKQLLDDMFFLINSADPIMTPEYIMEPERIGGEILSMSVPRQSDIPYLVKI